MKSKQNEVVTPLAEFFMDYLPNIRGLSANTICAYQYAFQLLFAFIMETKQLTPDMVTYQAMSNGIIDEFLSSLEEKRGCSAKTRNIRRAAIIAFAKYAAKKDFAAALPFYSEALNSGKKRVPKRQIVKYFTKEEISLLLSLPNMSKSTGQRDVTLLSVLYATGARAQELCDVTLKDITLANATSPTKIKLTGKGNKSRVVTIPESCTAILKGYLFSKGYSVYDKASYERHLFSSQTNEHMSIACVEEIVLKYVTLAKAQYPNLFRESKYTPHSFRHSIAVHMLEAGDSLITIKAFLGHSSITTTTIYANVTPELANKYLDERGNPLERISVPKIPQSLPEALPFLYR